MTKLLIVEETTRRCNWISVEKNLNCCHCRFPLVSELSRSMMFSRLHWILPYSLLKCHKENKRWHEMILEPCASVFLSDPSLLAHRRTIEDKGKTTTNQTNWGKDLKKDNDGEVLLCKYFLRRSLTNININQCF